MIVGAYLTLGIIFSTVKPKNTVSSVQININFAYERSRRKKLDNIWFNIKNNKAVYHFCLYLFHIT